MGIDILYSEQCYQIQGAVYDVYKEMGSGFLEAVYQECLGKEFLRREIAFKEHQELRLFYKGELLRQNYIPDFVCNETIIVEIKALSATTATHRAQVLNYLKATKMRLGLLVNFGCYPKATVERIVR